MAEFLLTDFTINTSNTNEDVLKLMKIIKPHWNETEIEIKIISGGYSCILYRISPSSGSEAVTLRIRNLFADKDVARLDRGFERKIVQVASKLGLFAKIHAIFKNGYCYEYIEGKPIYNISPKPSDVKTTFNFESLPYKLIAKKLAQIHCIKTEGDDYAKTEFFTQTRNMAENLYPITPHPHLADKENIVKEYNEIANYTNQFDFNIVLCHGDPHPGNIVWNLEKNEVTFVDWELVHIGPQAYDVASFLMTATGPEFIRMCGLPPCDEDIAKNIRRNFLRFYLEAYCEMSHITLNETYFANFERQVKFCGLMLYLNYSIVMGVLLPESSKCPNWENLSKVGLTMFNLYLASKNTILTELNLYPTC